MLTIYYSPALNIINNLCRNVLALGCFWKPEENFKNKPGIIETEVGYAGGQKSNVSYEEVCTGNTGHAEVVRLTLQ